MNTERKPIRLWIYGVYLALGLVLALIIGLNMVFMAQQGIGILVAFIAFLLPLLVLMMLAVKIEIPPIRLAIGLGLCAFMLKFAAAVLIDAEPTSDFQIIYQASLRLAQGDMSFDRRSYFHKLPYQLGFVFYQSVILRLFGHGKMALWFANSLWMAGTNVLVYLFARRVSGDDRCGAFAGVFYLFFPAPYFLASVLTNQHLSTFLILLGLYILWIFREKRILPFAAGGLCVALGNAIRPVGIVAVCAVLGYCFLQFLSAWRNSKGNRGKALWQWPVRGSMTVGVYILTSFILSQAVIFSGLGPYGLKNNDPLWKFAAGLNMSTDGGYSQEMRDAINNSSDSEAYQWDMIRESLSRPIDQWAVFMLHKADRMWASPEPTQWSFGTIIHDDVSDQPQKALQQKIVLGALGIEKVYYTWAMILALITVALFWRHKMVSVSACLIFLMILAYFAIHVVIEVQPRYRYCIMPYLFIFTGYCLPAIEKRFQRAPDIVKKIGGKKACAGAGNAL